MSDGIRNRLAFRRLLAFLIDYLIVLAYIAVLLGITLVVFSFFEASPSALDPLRGQVVGFVTLTLPVFLYFYSSENGPHRATIGKRKMGLKVVRRKPGNVLLRNILKFLPWELAHTGVHWVVYTASLNGETPPWVFVVLIAPQLMGIVYLATIF